MINWLQGRRRDDGCLCFFCAPWTFYLGEPLAESAEVWRCVDDRTRSAIGDGKLCLTAGKPQSGAACGKSAAINMCLEVAQHCSTSPTPNDSEVSAPRRLRYRSTSGYAWFAISDGTSSLRALLQHRITSPTDGPKHAQPLRQAEKNGGPTICESSA